MHRRALRIQSASNRPCHRLPLLATPNILDLQALKSGEPVILISLTSSPVKPQGSGRILPCRRYSIIAAEILHITLQRTSHCNTIYQQAEQWRTSMANATTTLMVRLDQSSKTSIATAAKMRRISISDYVRSVTVTQAEREIQQADQQTIGLAPAEQLAFWNALNEPVELTAAQQRLAALMRGE